MKPLLRIAPLALLLLFSTLAPAAAGEPAPAPAAQPAAAEAPAGCPQQSVDPVADALGVAPAFRSVPAPLFASHPCPVVRCLYSPCTHSSECTAAPGGSCSLYCTHPKAGCCTYP